MVACPVQKIPYLNLLGLTTCSDLPYAFHSHSFSWDTPLSHFFLLLFIYLFMAVLGPRFCTRAFSSCGKRGPLFIAVCGPLLCIWSTGSRCAGSVIVAHGPSCSTACGIFPRPGLEPVSPALAGRFSTTAPRGKPKKFLFYIGV